MRHHVHLASWLHYLVQQQKHISDVASPTAHENFLCPLLNSFGFRRFTNLHAIRRLRLVGVIILRDDNNLITLRKPSLSLIRRYKEMYDRAIRPPMQLLYQLSLYQDLHMYLHLHHRRSKTCLPGPFPARGSSFLSRSKL